jgi:hypothetical protein
VVTKQSTYVHIGDAIGSFTQIECRKETISATFTGQILVRDLISESDQVFEDTIALNQFHESFADGLLAVLHASRLNSYDPWRLQRFRNSDYPYRALTFRGQEVDILSHLKMAPGREGIFQVRKYVLQPCGPLTLIELSVTGKSISSGAGAVLRHEFQLRYLLLEFRTEVAEEQLSRVPKIGTKVTQVLVRTLG